jgi:hypothetical protein
MDTTVAMPRDTVNERPAPSENRATPLMAHEDLLDVWGGAAVTCRDDGRAGTLTGVVTMALTPRVTAIVVRDSTADRPWHPVPLADIDTATRDRIAVSLTLRALRARTFPTRVVVINEVRHDLWDDLELDAGSWMPPEPPLRIPVTVPRLEPGEVLVTIGIPVYAHRQRRIGHLRGMRIDRATGRLTGLVVDVRAHWHSHPVVVPAPAIDELSEVMVRLCATREEIRDMPRAEEPREHHDLTPREPHEVGVAESEPDSAHVEAARVLADEAEHELAARGFRDDQIRHWAEAYCREHHSGDLEAFLAWIDQREEQSRTFAQ